MKVAEPHIALLTENLFHCGYLVTEWLSWCEGDPRFLGVLIRDDPPGESSREQRRRLHEECQDRTDLDPATIAKLRACHQELSRSEEVLLRDYGPPRLAADSYERTHFLGSDLNSEETRGLVRSLFAGADRVVLFVFLDKLLAPWWLEMLDYRIINAHSAVLPWARGMYAIERTAVHGDPAKYRQACGATVHFVDEGVDTGPIIRASRINEPFRFGEIWEAKAHIYLLAFRLLSSVAEEFCAHSGVEPVGTLAQRNTAGRSYAAAGFTPELRQAAERRYQEMKREAESSGPSPIGVAGSLQPTE